MAVAEIAPFVIRDVRRLERRPVVEEVRDAAVATA
jgi:hypothetical protein